MYDKKKSAWARRPGVCVRAGEWHRSRHVGEPPFGSYSIHSSSHIKIAAKEPRGKERGPPFHLLATMFIRTTDAAQGTMRNASRPGGDKGVGIASQHSMPLGPNCLQASSEAIAPAHAQLLGAVLERFPVLGGASRARCSWRDSRRRPLHTLEPMGFLQPRSRVLENHQANMILAICLAHPRSPRAVSHAYGNWASRAYGA